MCAAAVSRGVTPLSKPAFSSAATMAHFSAAESFDQEAAALAEGNAFSAADVGAVIVLSFTVLINSSYQRMGEKSSPSHYEELLTLTMIFDALSLAEVLLEGPALNLAAVLDRR
jgi:hypothetical protein